MLKATTTLWQAAALTTDLLRTNLPRQWFRRSARAHVGLAISGGIDSMALATLCSQLRQSQEGNGLSFTAFIVDHGLRQGSDEEALTVAKNLKELDLPSQIITLDPKQYGNAHATGKVESVARRLRYRAMGQECHRRGITKLLFAHHADDQAETALMRLANNYLGTGLAGMRREARIPECEGMYGVHDSGTPRALLREGVLEGPNIHSRKMSVESGGLSILRPLLDFTKDRLIATCEASSVPWVEDQTNKDRSLTLRNTVRYLHEEDRLPVALRRPSLCALAARVAEQTTQLETRADEIFCGFDIAFDARSGHATCKIDHQIASAVNAMPNCDHVKAILLRKLLLLVAPTENIELSTLEAATHGFMGMNNKQPEDVSPAPIAIAGASIAKSKDEFTAMVYELRRTPPAKNAKGLHVDISLPSQQRHKNPKKISWSNWEFWDGRYWIRIGGYGPNTLPTMNVVVRTLTPEDIRTLRQNVDSSHRLDKRLASIKGHLRTTLPVIVQTLPDKQSRIVALPSLYWSRDSWLPAQRRSPEANPNTMYYDIRYKHIEDSLTTPIETKPNVL